MTVHKLTAGDGYTYLTRQVAANDATNRGYDNLGAYYDEKVRRTPDAGPAKDRFPAGRTMALRSLAIMESPHAQELQ